MDFAQKALTADDVAQMLEVSKNTVYALAKSGSLSSYKVGRKLRFTVEDVQGYIQRSRGNSNDAETVRSHASESSRSDTWTPPIAGLGRRTVRTEPDTLLLGGTDAVLDGFASCLAEAGVPVLRSYQNSYQALVDLYFGYLDAAVVSLWDSTSGTCNLPYIKRLLPGVPVKVFRMATYTQGLLVQKGNPKGLRTWGDILHSGAVLANREKGSTARILLDEQLRVLEADPKTVPGYDRELPSGLMQGSLIARRDADVGIGGEKVFRQVQDLGYLPLITCQLVLVVAKRKRTDPAMRTVRACLGSTAFKETVAGMVGYDFTSVGECLYET